MFNSYSAAENICFLFKVLLQNNIAIIVNLFIAFT